MRDAIRNAVFGAGCMLLALHVFVAVQACQRPPEKPACSPKKLAELDAAYVGEAIAACAGKGADECSELPAIEKKYAAKREEWVQCR